jgi:hypothetical protein
MIGISSKGFGVFGTNPIQSMFSLIKDVLIGASENYKRFNVLVKDVPIHFFIKQFTFQNGEIDYSFFSYENRIKAYIAWNNYHRILDEVKAFKNTRLIWLEMK